MRPLRRYLPRCPAGFRPGLFSIAKGYRYVISTYRRLCGITSDNIHQHRVISGQSWDDFCDALKAAGTALSYPGAPTDPLSQAEGYRYLSRLARGALENFVESADVYRPRLTAIANGLRDAPIKLGSDSPDNLYESATIDGRLSYKLTVQSGSAKLIGIGTQAGGYGTDGGLKTVDYRMLNEMKKCSDSNYLRTVTEPSAGMIIVRQTFGNRSKELPAKISIDCLSDKPETDVITCEALDNALSSAQLFVAGVPIMFAQWAWRFQSHANQLPLFDQELSNSVGGDPNIRYFHSYWSLADDEALIITAMPPSCKFWNFQLNNYWMESLDYRYFPIHVNKYTANYKEDGSIRIIVSKKDPSLANEPYNWISTTGHKCGTMSFRWISPEVDGADLPLPRTQVIDITTLYS
eukprot:gene10585-2708_t